MYCRIEAFLWIMKNNFFIKNSFIKHQFLCFQVVKILVKTMVSKLQWEETNVANNLVYDSHVFVF